MNETASKTFTGLPPHWSVSVRFDILMAASMGYDDNLILNIDTYGYGAY